MAVRLGNFIYLAGSILAVLWVAFAIWNEASSETPIFDSTHFYLMVGPAIVFWVIGRGARYFLAGR